MPKNDKLTDEPVVAEPLVEVQASGLPSDYYVDAAGNEFVVIHATTGDVTVQL